MTRLTLDDMRYFRRRPPNPTQPTHRLWQDPSVRLVQYRLDSHIMTCKREQGPPTAATIERVQRRVLEILKDAGRPMYYMEIAAALPNRAGHRGYSRRDWIAPALQALMDDPTEPIRTGWDTTPQGHQVYRFYLPRTPGLPSGRPAHYN